MDRRWRITVRVAGLILLAAFLFQPFRELCGMMGWKW
jgi:hypothetical protein